MKELIYVNPNKEDNCEVCNLNPNWKSILFNYMSLRYITCNTYEVHNSYFIAIDNVDDDTIAVLNKAKVTIYSIDYIVNCVMIRFKDEKSRDLVFKVRLSLYDLLISKSTTISTLPFSHFVPSLQTKSLVITFTIIAFINSSPIIKLLNKRKVLKVL